MDEHEKMSLSQHIQNFEVREAQEGAVTHDAVPAKEDARAHRIDILKRQIAQHVETLGGILAEETRAVEVLDTGALGKSAERKEELIALLEDLWEQARYDRHHGAPGVESGLRSAVNALRLAVDRNLLKLQTLQVAIRHVANLRLQAIEEHSREGIYAATGSSVRAAELSPLGMALDL